MAATDVKKMPVKSVSGEDMKLFTCQNHRLNIKALLESYKSLLATRIMYEIPCQICTKISALSSSKFENLR